MTDQELHKWEQEALFVLQKEPFNALSHNNLGVIAHHRGDAPTAATHFHTALRCNPFAKDTWENLQILSPEAHQEPFILKSSRIALLPGREPIYTRDLFQYFSIKNEVRILNPKDPEFIPLAQDWADIIFSLSFSLPLVTLSKTLHRSRRLFARVESDEVLFDPLWQEVSPDNFGGVVFAAPSLLAAARARRHKLLEYCYHTVLPASVNLLRTPLLNYSPSEPAILGIIALFSRKGSVDLLISNLEAVSKAFPEMSFRVLVEVIEVQALSRFKEWVANAGLSSRVAFVPSTTPLPHFAFGLMAVLAVSEFEGSPYLLFETVGCGVRPLVYKWAGAELLFEEEALFSTSDELIRKLHEKRQPPEHYRAWIAQRYNAEKEFRKLDAFLFSNHL